MESRHVQAGERPAGVSPVVGCASIVRQQCRNGQTPLNAREVTRLGLWLKPLSPVGRENRQAGVAPGLTP